jgi:outer membrane protein
VPRPDRHGRQLTADVRPGAVLEQHVQRHAGRAAGEQWRFLSHVGPRLLRGRREQARELQRRRREFQEDLSQRKNEELATVVERTNRVIKQIFESEKYDLILQEAVFWSPKVDITDKVIKALNAQGGK